MNPYNMQPVSVMIIFLFEELIYRSKVYSLQMQHREIMYYIIQAVPVGCCPETYTIRQLPMRSSKVRLWISSELQLLLLIWKETNVSLLNIRQPAHHFIRRAHPIAHENLPIKLRAALTMSTSEMGPMLRTMMSTSTVAGGPPKSGRTLLS